MPRWLSNWLAAGGVAVAVAAAAVTFLLMPSWVVSDSTFAKAKPRTVEGERLKARNEVRTAGIALLAFLGVVAGSILTWRTVRLTRDGQLIDRLSAAVTALGSEDETAQLGAILALGGVARTSARERDDVLELLVEYVRRSAGAWDRRAEADPLGPREVPPGLRAGIRVLGSFPLKWTKDRYLELAGLDLRNVDFSGADLRYANLTGSNLSGAFLPRVRLQHAQAEGIVAKHARWESARLMKAHLGYADLETRPPNLRDADFRRADVKGATFKTPVPDAKGLPDSIRRGPPR